MHTWFESSGVCTDSLGLKLGPTSWGCMNLTEFSDLPESVKQVGAIK